MMPRARRLTRATWVAIAVLATAAVVAALWLVSRPVQPAPVRIGYRHQPPLYYAPPGGVAVDVVGEAARRLGVPVQWTRIEGPSSNALLAGAIDVWPTFPAVSQVAGIAVTEPWLESTFLSISKASTPKADLDRPGRRVAVIDSPFPTDIFADKLRDTVRIRTEASGQSLAALCAGEADAAIVEGREFQDLMLSRPAACEGVALTFGPTPVAVVQYGVGSTVAAAKVADALRAEITRMAEDGQLARIHARWALGTAGETRVVYSLGEARKREQWTYVAIVAMMAALLLSLWQLRRSRQARKLAERASTAMADYASQQERYRLLFERNMAGVVRSTAEGEILDCNLAFARMVGCSSKEEVLSISAWQLYETPADRKAVLDRLQREVAISNIENRVVRKDGSRGWLLQSVTRIDEGPGKPVTLEWTAIDITEQRRLEDQIRQAQKLESVGQLAGGVAHDFNNLLTAINGHTELLLADLPPDSRLRWPLEEIQKAGLRGAALTQQLLAFGRKQLLQPVVLDVNQVVTEVAGLLKRVVEENISLNLRLDPALGVVRADEGQLHQVLMNLALNARDAMPGGGVLTLETANVELDETAAEEPVALRGPGVRLSVSDTGHGMDAETRRHVFEPFFTTKGLGKGTGLGLSTVYGIVRQSGGLVTVDTIPGEGTRFDIYLPRVGGSQDRAAGGGPHTRLGGRDGHGRGAADSR